MKNKRLPAGRRLRLQCRVRGTPLPRVTWFKNGKPINATRRIRLKMKKKKRRLQSQLIIRRAIPSDSGSYECRARNRVGKDAKRTRVSVSRRRRTRPPPRPQPTGPDKPRPPDSWRAPEPCDIQSYCLNGGTCILYRSVMEYVCQCADGFKGTRCGSKTVYAIKQWIDEPVLKAAQYQPLMLVLGGITVLLLLLVLLAVLCHRRSSSRPRGRPPLGNGAVAMATDETSEPAETAAAAVSWQPAAPADRSEQVSCRPPAGPSQDCPAGAAGAAVLPPSPPPSPPSPSSCSRRASPAGADGAAAGEGAPAPALPSASSVEQLEALLDSLVPSDPAGTEACVHTKDA